MKHLFIPYELAVIAKEKRFDEPCLTFYFQDKDLFEQTNLREEWFNSKLEKYYVSAPLYQQIVDWFRSKHNIFINVTKEFTGSDEWEFIYSIEYLPKEFESAKCRCPNFQTKNSYKEGIGTYSGAWSTYYEAMGFAIQEAFKLI